jgi:outer membrane protein
MNKVFLLFVLCWFRPHFTIAQGWTLQQCLDAAIKNNLTILQSDLEVKSNELALDQSKWNRYPTLNANLGQSGNFGRSVDQTTYQVNNKATASGTYSLSSGVVLYNGGQLRNAILQNQWNLNASGFDLQQAKYDISLAVVNAFIQVIYAQEAVKNAQLQVQTTQAQIESLQIFVTAGKRAESDLFQLKAQQSSDRYNVSVAEGQLRSARLSIQQLMEVPYDAFFDVQAPILPDQIIADIPTPQAVFEAALQTQPVVKSNELKIKSAESGLRIAQGALQPKISMTAGLSSNYSNGRKTTTLDQQNILEPIGYLKSNPNETVLGYVSQSLYNTNSYPFLNQVKDNFNQSIALNVSIPIFNSLQARNNIRKQEIAITIARTSEQTVRNQVRKNVEQAYVDLINARSKYEAAGETLRAEAVSFQNLKIRFEADKTTATDLLVEQNKYFLTQSQLLQARYDFVLKLKVMDYYQGKPLGF